MPDPHDPIRSRPRRRLRGGGRPRLGGPASSWFDVNVSVVGGERGLLVVDTHASERAPGAGRRRWSAGCGAGEVVAVVNTHEHFDHTFGNGVFAEAYDGRR